MVSAARGGGLHRAGVRSLAHLLWAAHCPPARPDLCLGLVRGRCADRAHSSPCPPQNLSGDRVHLCPGMKRPGRGFRPGGAARAMRGAHLTHLP